MGHDPPFQVIIAARARHPQTWSALLSRRWAGRRRRPRSAFGSASRDWPARWS